ncbi:hypothetical protein GCM10010299_44920 [Streptomyces tanashiensis]|nr:hypothetical protein GCM10010299_44920 [Streptomyces tanashiensis]
MPVAAGERDGERGSVAVDDPVVLGAREGTVDGRGADMIPPNPVCKQTARDHNNDPG